MRWSVLKLSGLTPIGVRFGKDARLVWNVNGEITETNFQRFLPVGVNLARDKQDLDLTWRDFGDVDLTQNFFEDSIKCIAELSDTSKDFRTLGDTLSLVARSNNMLPFSGAVFHMARTGSTLIHRVMSETKKVLSLSEVANFDRVMALTRNWPAEERNRVAQDFFAVFRRKRRDNEKYCIAKMTDGSASITLPSFRHAFPNTPWIFVYRDPAEVMASILARPTGHLNIWFKNRTDSSNRLRMPVLNDPGMWPAEFVARTLKRFCMDAVRAAKETPAHLFLAVDYARLPDAIWETIAPHFKIDLDDDDRARMAKAARYSAKKKELVEFVSDKEEKQAFVSPWVRELAETFVAPAIAQLKLLPQG